MLKTSESHKTFAGSPPLLTFCLLSLACVERGLVRATADTPYIQTIVSGYSRYIDVVLHVSSTAIKCATFT